MANETIEQQKTDLVSAIEFLRNIESTLNRQLFTLREGLNALDQGVDILNSDSNLAKKVREVMYQISKSN